MTECANNKKEAYLDVPGSEEELSVEVGLLNDVHVGDGHLTLGPTAQTDHCPVLEHLTTNSTGSNLKFKDIYM